MYLSESLDLVLTVVFQVILRYPTVEFARPSFPLNQNFVLSPSQYIFNSIGGVRIDYNATQLIRVKRSLNGVPLKIFQFVEWNTLVFTPGIDGKIF